VSAADFDKSRLLVYCLLMVKKTGEEFSAGLFLFGIVTLGLDRGSRAAPRRVNLHRA
jgi:hypothetical protein